MDFPLWRLKPEDAAHIIVLAPLQPVERHKFWYKRAMSLKGSSKKIDPARLRGARHKPRTDDLKRLDRAKYQGYWEAYLEAWTTEFPISAAKAIAKAVRVANPLPIERERPPFEGMYSRDAYEADMAYFEEARALVRENFILGQQGEGPYMDGLIYIKLDNLLLAEQDHCKARLRATWAILEAKKLERARHAPMPRNNDVWCAIGADEAVAMQFKHSGYPIRKVGLHNYEVLMNPKKARKP